MTTPLLRISDPAIPRSFDVVVERGRANEPVRIEADPGLEVRCGETGDFGPECAANLGPDAALRIWVRAEAMGSTSGMGDALGDVRVFVGESVETVGVTTTPDDGRPGGMPSPLAEGRYEGTATLVAIGVGTDPTTDGATSGSLVVPVSALVFRGSGSSGTLVLEDGLRVIHPNGSWVGRIEGTTNPTIDFPSIEFIESEGWTGGPIEILADALPTSAIVAGEAVSFVLPIRFVGVLAGERAPFVRWSIALSRVGDLPGGASPPSIPPDAVPTSTADDRANTPTPWEQAAASLIGPSNVLFMRSEEHLAIARMFRTVADSSPQSLRACTVGANTGSDDDLSLLGHTVLRCTWGDFDTCDEYSLVDVPISARVRGAFASSGASVTNVIVSLGVRGAPYSDIPCEVSFPRTSAGSTCAPGTTYRLGTIDVCEAMAEAYGCDVVDAGSGATTIVWVSSRVSAGSCSETIENDRVEGRTQRVCRLTPIAQSCAEQVLCYVPPRAGDPNTSSRFSDVIDERSGDLQCRTGVGPLFALDQELGRDACGAGSSSCIGALEVFEQCDDEIRTVLERSAPGMPSNLGALFAASPRCVDAARWLVALGFATEADRRRASDPTVATTPLASRVAHRLLQRMWLHGAMVAREAAQRERLMEVYRAHVARTGGTMMNVPTVARVLESLDPLWNLALHPRFATALDQMPGEILAHPDYRPVVLGEDVSLRPEHEQHVGLPVAMVEFLSAALGLLDSRLEWAALDRDRTALEPLARQLRVGLVFQALALDMARRAREAEMPAWTQRFEAAQNELNGEIVTLVTRASAILSSANPLGIEDEDLPLYFFGDESTATTRFSAISDFLIGQMPGSVISGSAWAPALVQLARDAWDDGFPHLVELLDRQVQVRQSEAELQSRLDEIRLDFGYRLAELCYPDHLATRDLLEHWDEFDENTCFYRSNREECRIDRGRYAALLTQQQLRFHMCVVAEARRFVGPSVTFGIPQLDRLADGYDRCSAPSYPVECPEVFQGAETCIRCTIDGDTIVAPMSPGRLRAIIGAHALPGALLETIRNTCSERYPDSDPSLPTAEDLANAPVDRRDCYNGAIGEAIYDLRSREHELQAARAEFEAARARYDIAMRSCGIQHLGDQQRLALMAQHDETMRYLEDVKLALDIVAHTADAAADCMEAFNDVDVLKVIFTGGAMATLAGLTCAARGVSHAMQATITGIEHEMERAIRSHERAMAMVEADTSFQVCANDASMELVDQRAALVRIQQASLELEAAYYRIEEMKITARTLYDDGRALLEATRARYVPPLSHDLWAGPAAAQVERFRRDMSLARRVTYLAVRAVEYELQQSLPQRDTVLRARLPDQLWAVLADLWTMTGTRSIRGNRPSDFKAVVSLRDHLLQLADRSDWEPTEHAYDEGQRFRLILTAPEYAVFAADGTYLGQRIPFQLAPLGAIRLGRAQGIPVLAGSDCAERLWTVNAAIVGDDIYRSRGRSAPTFTRIEILKRNTFYSQWCAPPSGGPEFQVASVRPSRNLFRDPQYGVGQLSGLGGPLGLANEATLESRARIEAYFNVERAEFERDEYANGSTSELAARGLYGEYALFIPAEVLSVDGSDGLVLENVEDILLRFDYVSVAR